MTSEWASYAPTRAKIVRAFVDGVNAWMPTSGPTRHRVHAARVAPEPWSYEVPLQRMAALAMTGNALEELERARLVHLVGVERTAALWPPDPARRSIPPWARSGRHRPRRPGRLWKRGYRRLEGRTTGS